MAGVLVAIAARRAPATSFSFSVFADIAFHAFEISRQQLFNDCAEAYVIRHRLSFCLPFKLRVDPDCEPSGGFLHGKYL